MSVFFLIFFVFCIVVLLVWYFWVLLNDIFKGYCCIVSFRVCWKSLEKFDLDYYCGFILRSVCLGMNKIERV